MIPYDTGNPGSRNQKPEMMSSKMRILKICKSCGREFEARTSVTDCCSDPCAKRFYKEKKRRKKMAQAELKTEIQRKPGAFITVEKVDLIQAKMFLDLKEAAILLNVSSLTLRRWVLAGRVASVKVGKKHLFNRVALISFKKSE